MADKPFVAYLRVSTEKQGASGLGMKGQQHAVETYASAQGRRIIETYVEVETGKRSDRPELEAAINACHIYGGVLLIAKLDRLSRNVAFIANLMESGVEFVAADMPSANNLTIHLMAALAEQERRMISDRTKTALAVKKREGVPLGMHHPSKQGMGALYRAQAGEKASIAAVSRLKEDADTRAKRLAPIIAHLKAGGHHTLQSLADALNARDILTPRNKQWHPETVNRLIDRIHDIEERTGKKLLVVRGQVSSAA